MQKTQGIEGTLETGVFRTKEKGKERGDKKRGKKGKEKHVRTGEYAGEHGAWRDGYKIHSLDPRPLSETRLCRGYFAAFARELRLNENLLYMYAVSAALFLSRPYFN